MNPIVQREVRTRWRRLFTFVIVFGYAAVLALATGWVYAEHMKQASAQAAGILVRTASPGYKLFIQLTWVQVLLWALLAPALTAPSIAGERERGLLESLHLSTLSVHQIVAGKLLSALAFIALLLLVPLPISALCFQLGGVSPGEFGLAFLLHAVTATTGAAFGLACSASSRGAGTALVTSLVFGVMSASIILLLHSAFLTNFIGIAISGILLQAMLAAILLEIARATLVFSSLEAEPLHSSYSVPPAALAAPRSAPGPASKPVLTPSLAVASAASTQDGTPSTNRWELPFTRRLQFSNPVLQREVRARLRWRDDTKAGNTDNEDRGSRLQWAILVAIPCLFMLLAGPGFREAAWWFCAALWMVAVAVSSTTMGAAAFTREREQGMLQPLLLTPLTPRDILFGKLGASIVVCAYYSTALLPVLVFCLFSVSLSYILTMVLVVTTAAWCCTAWGMFFSWFCRHTAIATAGAVSTLLFACLGLPSLYVSLVRSPIGEALRRWHLFPWLKSLLNPYSALGFFLDGILVTFVLFIGGCLLLVIVGVALRPTTLEKESKSFLFTDLTQSVH